MAEACTPTLKRTRTSKSPNSDSETNSPDDKRIFTSSFSTKLFKNDISPNGKPLDVSDDQVLEALTMTEKIGQQLQQILVRLERMETKLQTMEGTLGKISSLENAVNKIQANMESFNEKVKKMEGTIHEMEAGLTFTNKDIEEIKRRENQTSDKIKGLEDQILYQEVYSRRENLRLFGLPEEGQGSENTREVVYKFLESELELEDARNIEFQRVHRLGKKKAGQSRPIIARFLRFPERELVFRNVRDLGEESDVKAYADFPKEIRDRRKKLWPKLKQAREDGKVAFFDKREPDKLYINGILST